MKKKKSSETKTIDDLLERALAIAVQAHKGQRDRSGRPYVLHPLRLMMNVRLADEKIVAVLHDVIEDTSWTMDDLRKEGFPEEMLTALDCVTKREGEDYEAFVERSAKNPIARRVKIADLEDNMDARRLAEFTEKDAARMAKHLKAWRKLTELEKNARRK
jgi:(p)ppGpp synthase/HD superfamily hydrolase